MLHKTTAGWVGFLRSKAYEIDFALASQSIRDPRFEQGGMRAGLELSLIPAMAAQRKRHDLLEYRSRSAPRPTDKIVAVWVWQRPSPRGQRVFENQLHAIRQTRAEVITKSNIAGPRPVRGTASNSGQKAFFYTLIR